MCPILWMNSKNSLNKKMITKFYNRHQKSIFQFIKFGMIGGFGFLIDMSSVVMFKKLFAFHTLLCGLLGYLIATIAVYSLNRTWTFKGSTTSVVSGYILFFSVYGVGLAVRLFIMFMLVRFTGLDKLEWGFLLINVVGIAFASIFNFIGSKKIVFRC